MQMKIEVKGLNPNMESLLIDKIITCIIDDFGVPREDVLIDGNEVRPDDESECEFCHAPMVDCFDANGNEFLDCSEGCEKSAANTIHHKKNRNFNPPDDFGSIVA